MHIGSNSTLSRQRLWWHKQLNAVEAEKKARIDEMEAAVDAATQDCRDAKQACKRWEMKHAEVKEQYDQLVSQKQLAEDKTSGEVEDLRKDRESLKEQAEALKKENAELSDAARHTAGSSERAKAEMERKQTQIEQLQGEVARCKEIEATAAEKDMCEDTKEALLGRLKVAEDSFQEAEQELQRADERCTQATMLLEQATWSPAKNIQWTTDSKVVRHAVKVMEGGLTEAETGPIVVLVNVNDRKLTVIDTEDGQPTSVIAAIQREVGLGVCDHEEAAVKMNRKVSIMQAQWDTLMRVTEVWDLRVGDQVKVKFRANLSESTQKVWGEVLQRPFIRDEELHLDECSIKIQNIAQIWRTGANDNEAEETAGKGDNARDDFEQEHQRQPQFHQRNKKKIESDTESDSSSTHSSSSSNSEASFESRRHSPSKSRARTSPSKNTREASPTQSVRRSPSAARSRNSVALAYAEANHQPSREIKATAEVNDRMRKAGLANMIKGIVTKTDAGNAKFEAMWQIFVSPQMLFDFRVPLGGLASSMYKTLAPEDSDLKLIFDQMMEPDPNTRGSMVFLPRLIAEHSEPGEQESFRNWLCEEIYLKMTGNRYADKGKRRMQKQLKLARAGDEGALEAYIRQAVEELQEVATFTDKERYCTAVETLIEQIGWVTHPHTSAICDTAKRLFDKKKWSPGKLATKFCKMMISLYAPIIRAHAAALRAFMDKTTEASEVHLAMLPWMTPEIIGIERYELLPLRYKKQRESDETWRKVQLVGAPDGRSLCDRAGGTATKWRPKGVQH